MRIAWLCLMLTVVLSQTGCSVTESVSDYWAGPARFSVISQDNTTRRLQGTFTSAYYTYHSDDAVTVVLIEGDEQSPTQAATIRLMWNPKAGKTPITADATNATIQYIVFAERVSETDGLREVGVYNGAGFLFLESEPGDNRLNAELWNADMLLADRSDNFKDLLGQSTLKGSFSAKRDGEKVAQLIKQLGARVSDRLGYPRLVDTQPPDAPRLADAIDTR